LLIGLWVVVAAVWPYAPTRAQNTAILVRDVSPGPENGLDAGTELINVNGTLFFVGRLGSWQAPVTGLELWKSDGTDTGTVLVKDINPGIDGSLEPMGNFHTAVLGNTLYFNANDGTHGWELWKSDGTEAGTVLVKDINPLGDSNPAELAAAGGKVFFRASDGVNGDELWVTDGTAAGTDSIIIRPGTSCCLPQQITPVGNLVFFVGIQNNGGELWKSDGTVAGTVEVKDINPGGSSSSPDRLTDVGGTLMFFATDGVSGRELWKSNGTDAGTQLVKDIYPGAQPSPNFVPGAVLNNALFFFADDGVHGMEVWRSDGTNAGTTLLKDINPGPEWSSTMDGLRTGNGLLWWSPFDGVHASEPWVSDGTPAGTRLLMDIEPGGTNGSSATGFTASGGAVFFSAWSIDPAGPQVGTELWKSDGTTAGTVLVRDIRPGPNSSSPSRLTDVDGTLFFDAFEDIHGREIWKTVSAPVISSLIQTLDFPIITVGDTIIATIPIINTGEDTLTVSSVQTPTAELRVVTPLPVGIEAGQAGGIDVSLEPRSGQDGNGDLFINSNDPVTPVYAIPVTTDIRALEISGKLLSPTAEAPLGQAATVIVSPAPDVHVERGFVAYRPIGASTFEDSLALVKFEDDFIAVIPPRDVTETGLEYYFKVENSGLFAVDPPGAPGGGVFTQLVAAPTTITTSVQPNRGLLVVEDSEVQVLVDLPTGAEFVQGALYVRRGGETNYVEIPLVAVGSDAGATVPDTLVGPRGLEYWAGVKTITTTVTSPASSPAKNPHSTRVTVFDIAEPAAYPGGTYRMFSIPLRLTGTIAGAVSDDLGGVDNTQWRMFQFDRINGTYIEIPNDTLTTFDPAVAYWLITKDARQLDTGPVQGLTPRTDVARAITLVPGFNMIANPFNFAVAWDSMTVNNEPMSLAEGVAVDPPIRWTGQGYASDVEVFEPFAGFWVNNRTPSTVTLRVPAQEALPIVTARSRGTLRDSDNWTMRIAASTARAADIDNVAALRSGAAHGSDRHDRFEPPLSPARSISLYFVGSSASRYSYDVRPSTESYESDWGHVWHFDVAKNYAETSSGDEVTLTFGEMPRHNEQIWIHLIDKTMDRVIDVTSSHAYSYYVGEREFVRNEDMARFALVVGSEEFVIDREGTMAHAPTQTALYHNSPNPFNPTTVVRYDLARAGHVTLSVYNVRGALVKTLENRPQPRGRHEVRWHGDDSEGRAVATGVYFYRLSAPGFSQTMKMLLLK
jgi:ELWxxDGT repeat protein